MAAPADLETEAMRAAHAARAEALRSGADPVVAGLAAYSRVRYGEPAPPALPVIPPRPTPDMTVVKAATAERCRLRALGRVRVVSERADGRFLVRVERENGQEFHCVADLDHPQDVVNAVDFALRRRIEQERTAERERLDQLRRRARKAEDEVDRRRLRDHELDRLGAHDRRLAPAEARLERVDRDLFHTIEEAV